MAFGCLFGILALLGAWIIVAIVVAILDGLGFFGGPGSGPIQLGSLMIAAVGLVAIVAVSRTFRMSAGTLDALIDVARRLEAGDYRARVGAAARGPRPVRELARAFDTLAERLEVDETRRNALLADVSHELRTPLAVIRGNLEAIVDGIHPADEANIAGLIEETRVMERLVEDLRTLSLAEAGRLQLHREPTDPDVLLGEVAAGFQAESDRTGVSLELQAPDYLPILNVDPVRVREVITNLVGNAFRYTPRGGRITVSGESANGRAVLFSVADNGSGIDPDLLPSVFDRFTKGRDSRGSGLGLAIARDLVLAHGGTIEVRSEPGQGTVFEVRLPADPPA